MNLEIWDHFLESWADGVGLDRGKFIVLGRDLS